MLVAATLADFEQRATRRIRLRPPRAARAAVAGCAGAPDAPRGRIRRRKRNPAGARRYQPDSRPAQGNAFIPSSAATAKPETFVSWSGEPG